MNINSIVDIIYNLFKGDKMDELTTKLSEQLEVDEGKKLFPYKCTAGKTTIGIGHNLDDNGISEDVCNYIFNGDVKLVIKDVERNLPFYNELSEPRKGVVLNMVFNMGIKKFLKFKKTINFLVKKQFVNASLEMLDSSWSKQVGNRALRLSKQMKTDKWVIG